MNIVAVRSFLAWCTVLNAGLLSLSFLVCALAGDWVYRMHSRWFPMPRETFNVTIYQLLGVFKILFLILNVVPCVALWIIR